MEQSKPKRSGNEKYLHTCAKSWHRRAAAEVGKAPIPKCTSNARAHANRDHGEYPSSGVFLGIGMSEIKCSNDCDSDGLALLSLAQRA
jgi:hypothetical protein